MQVAPSRRATAVANAYPEMLCLIREAQGFEPMQAIAETIDPEALLQLPQDGTVPKWRLDLVLTLSRLDEQGYADATTDTEGLGLVHTRATIDSGAMQWPGLPPLR